MMKRNWTATLNPPAPKAANANNNNNGKQLLNLIRTLERVSNQNDDERQQQQQQQQQQQYEKTITQILLLLESMQESFLRKGLLQHDLDRAEYMHNILYQNSNNHTNDDDGGKGYGRSKKKRKRGGGGSKRGGSASIVIFNGANDDHHDHNDTSNSPPKDGTASADEALVLSAISRILVPTKNSSMSDASKTVSSSPPSSSGLVFKYPPIIVRAGANVLSAICQHSMNAFGGSGAGADSANDSFSCSSMEKQMILGMSSQVLSGLSKHIHRLCNEEHPCDDENAGKHEEERIETIAICCKCASCIILLAGTRLSRNTSVLHQVESAAHSALWNTLNFNNYEEASSSNTNRNKTMLLDSASRLLAVLPLAGNSNGIPPSKLWTERVRSTALSISTTLNTFFPIFHKRSHIFSSQSAIQDNSDDNGKHAIQWIEQNSMKSSMQTQTQRTIVFQHCIEGYTYILVKLLSLDAYDDLGCQLNKMNALKLPIATLLDVVDRILSFAPSVESSYHSTKSRLRDIPVQDGLLSPNAAVVVANCIKFHGMEVFKIVLTSLNGGCIRYGRKIIRIVSALLRNTASLALRRTVDPSSIPNNMSIGSETGRIKKRKQMWLHSSIYLRARAIECFRYAMQMIGLNAIVAHTESVSKGLLLVVGSLLEQMSVGGEEAGGAEDSEEHWGTVGERVELITMSVDTIAACLTVFGGYMPLQTRETIESLSSTCLTHLHNGGRNSSCSLLLAYSASKAAILKLCTNCVTTPWPDGGASNLAGMLRDAASVLKFDRNGDVSAAAYSALCVCNLWMTPRAPPLIITTRNCVDGAIPESENDSRTSNFLSSEVLVAGINAANRETAAEKRLEKKQKDDNVDHYVSMDIDSSGGKIVEKEEEEEPKNKDKKKSVSVKSGNEENKIDLESRTNDIVIKPISNVGAGNQEQYEKEDYSMNAKNEGMKMDSYSANHAESINLNNIPDDNYSTLENQAILSSVQLPKTEQKKQDLNESDDDLSDADLPEIVDCDPDDEDM